MATDEQIADALAGRYGPVSMRFGYDDRGHDFRFIQSLDSAVLDPAPRLSLDNKRATMRTLIMNLDPEALPANFDFHQNHIAPHVEVLVGDEWVRFYLGLFHVDEVRYKHGEEHTVIEARCTDLSYHLLETTSEPYTLVAGTQYMPAIADILHKWNLHTMLPATAVALPIDVTWPAMTTWQTIVSDLAYGCGYYTPWANQEGAWVSKPKALLSENLSDVTYSDQFEPRMIVAEADFERTTVRERLANQWGVIIDNPLHPDFGGYIRSNVTPNSTVSTLNRNVDAKESKSDTTRAMVSAEMARATADYHLSDEDSLSKPGQLITLPDPRRTSHEFYWVDIGGVEDGMWRVLGWDLTLQEGARMNHRLSRVTDVVLSTVVVPDE